MSLGVLISVFFLLYRNGELLATSEVRSVPLGKKRKPGRPKKLPMCLSRMVVEEVEDYAIIFLNKDGIIKSWNTGAEKIKLFKFHL